MFVTTHAFREMFMKCNTNMLGPPVLFL